MRRAEKAGREDASKWIAQYDLFGMSAENALKKVDSPPHAWLFARFNRREALAEHIGARQLTGRAWTAALEAYDRGYRARLQEEIKALEALAKETASKQCAVCGGSGFTYRPYAEPRGYECMQCMTIKPEK
jgi:hypothetical protein